MGEKLFRLTRITAERRRMHAESDRAEDSVETREASEFAVSPRIGSSVYDARYGDVYI